MVLEVAENISLIISPNEFIYGTYLLILYCNKMFQMKIVVINVIIRLRDF